jgi:hypothetical protein
MLGGTPVAGQDGVVLVVLDLASAVERFVGGVQRGADGE